MRGCFSCREPAFQNFAAPQRKVNDNPPASVSQAKYPSIRQAADRSIVLPARRAAAQHCSL
jgi:hypothetical protein